ncbi:MAG: RdgB/HAM1 family non-canonical purine NTP pyrophosphatase [Alphaproteobacteria bacterium]
MSSRIFAENKLLIATSNKGKIKEFENLLAGKNIELVSLEGYNIEPPEENGKDFTENAVIKSKFYSKTTNLVALADDSGLCIDALGGEPGIYAARWAEQEGGYDKAMAKIEQRFKELDIEESNARFVCVISVCWPDGNIENFEGIVEGKIKFPPKGTNGFGYDSIFIPEGYSKTFAEMTTNEKLPISHRYLAFKKFIDNCFNEK